MSLLAYFKPAKSLTPNSEQMRFVSSKLDSLPNKIPQFSIHQITKDVDVVEIKRVVKKTTVSLQQW